MQTKKNKKRSKGFLFLSLGLGIVGTSAILGAILSVLPKRNNNENSPSNTIFLSTFSDLDVSNEKIEQLKEGVKTNNILLEKIQTYEPEIIEFKKTKTNYFPIIKKLNEYNKIDNELSSISIDNIEHTLEDIKNFNNQFSTINLNVKNIESLKYNDFTSFTNAINSNNRHSDLWNEVNEKYQKIKLLNDKISNFQNDNVRSLIIFQNEMNQFENDKDNLKVESDDNSEILTRMNLKFKNLTDKNTLKNNITFFKYDDLFNNVSLLDYLNSFLNEISNSSIETINELFNIEDTFIYHNITNNNYTSSLIKNFTHIDNSIDFIDNSIGKFLLVGIKLFKRTSQNGDYSIILNNMQTLIQEDKTSVDFINGNNFAKSLGTIYNIDVKRHNRYQSIFNNVAGSIDIQFIKSALKDARWLPNITNDITYFDSLFDRPNAKIITREYYNDNVITSQEYVEKLNFYNDILINRNILLKTLENLFSIIKDFDKGFKHYLQNSNITHELNSPLGLMISNIDFNYYDIMKNINTYSNQDIEEKIKQISNVFKQTIISFEDYVDNQNTFENDLFLSNVIIKPFENKQSSFKIDAYLKELFGDNVTFERLIEEWKNNDNAKKILKMFIFKILTQNITWLSYTYDKDILVNDSNIKMIGSYAFEPKDFFETQKNPKSPKFLYHSIIYKLLPNLNLKSFYNSFDENHKKINNDFFKDHVDNYIVFDDITNHFIKFLYSHLNRSSFENTFNFNTLSIKNDLLTNGNYFNSLYNTFKLESVKYIINNAFTNNLDRYLDEQGRLYDSLTPIFIDDLILKEKFYDKRNNLDKNDVIELEDIVKNAILVGQYKLDKKISNAIKTFYKNNIEEKWTNIIKKIYQNIESNNENVLVSNKIYLGFKTQFPNNYREILKGLIKKINKGESLEYFYFYFISYNNNWTWQNDRIDSKEKYIRILEENQI